MLYTEQKKENGGICLKRHESEMDIIYRKYYKDVLLFANSLAGSMDVAEEITQNTFYKAVKNIHKFRGDCNIKVWLCKIARNDYLNYVRKQKRVVLDIDTKDMLESISDDRVNVLGSIEDKESAREIKEILEKLDEPYKGVFTMKVINELPYQGIAKSYGKTESWARVTYYRAKAKIISMMESKTVNYDRKG